MQFHVAVLDPAEAFHDDVEEQADNSRSYKVKSDDLNKEQWPFRWLIHGRACADRSAYTQSVSLAKESYDLVRYRYEEGLAVITDLLDASNQLLDAQIQEVNARMNIAYNYYKKGKLTTPTQYRKCD